MLCITSALFIFAGILHLGSSYFDKLFSVASGTVKVIQFHGQELNRYRETVPADNPTLFIVLNEHEDVFVYKDKRTRVKNVQKQIKVGDKLELVTQSIQDKIWGITINDKQVVSIEKTKEEEINGSINKIILGLFLFVMGVAWSIFKRTINKKKQ